jgi:hypothetical protein
MPRHLVVAPQPGYEGKTLGVMFHNSQAVVDEHSVDAKLGRTPAQVIETFKKDFPAYTVEALGGPVAVTVPEMPWKAKDEGGRMKAEAKAKAEKPKGQGPRAKAAKAKPKA